MSFFPYISVPETEIVKTPPAMYKEVAWDYVKNEIIRYEGDFMKGQSTALGYLNKNNQRNMGKTNEKGTDHCSVLYMMRCEDCGHEYFANSTDIHLKKCPNCQGGAETVRYN